MGQKIDDWTQRYAQWVIRWRWLVILGVLAIATIPMSGAPRVMPPDTDYRVFFGKNNPQLKEFDTLEAIYTKNDNVLIAIEPPGDDGFNRTTLTLVADMTEDAWKLPYSSRVDSITNYQHTEAVGDDLSVADLVADPRRATQADFDKARRIGLSEPILFKNLVSPDGRMVGVNVTFEIPGESIMETPEIVEAVRALRDDYLERYPDHRIYLTGAVMINNAFSESAQADLATLIPAMYLIVIVSMWILLRSAWGTVATLFVIGLSAMVGIGLGGYAGIRLTPPSASAPTIIMTLAVADSIHILVTLFQQMRRGMTRHEALIESVRLNFIPVLLTSLTTAMGFLTINFTDSPPLRDLGNISAMGIMAAWFFSVTLLPALISIMPMRVPQEDGRMHRMMDSIGAWVVAWSRPILLVGTLVTVGILALIPRNEANDQFHEFFEPDIQFRSDTDYVIENMSGFYPIHYNLDTGEAGAISDPEYLQKLEAFEAFWREIPKVSHISNFSTIMKRLNKNMHGDDESWYRIPDDRELAAQYLLLYEMSLPFGLDLNNQVDIDKSGTRFTVRFDNISSKETRYYAQLGEQWLRENAPELFSYGTSPPVMFSYISERNIKAMFIGMPVALVGISLLLIIALGSLKMGLLCLVPNLVPLGLAFGVWAVIDGQINFTMAVVMGMTLGIIVDDTIHFMSKYLRARREYANSAPDAVRHALRTVGAAIVVTSLILVAGFILLGTSSFLPNSSLSNLTAIAIVAAVVCDLLLLPTLLIFIDRNGTGQETDDTIANMENRDAQTATA